MLDDQTKNSPPGLKDPTNFLPKMVANCGEDLFIWSSPNFVEKTLQFSAKTCFLFFVFIQFRRRKYIISSKVGQGCKRSPHAKFYSLSTTRTHWLSPPNTIGISSCVAGIAPANIHTHFRTYCRFQTQDQYINLLYNHTSTPMTKDILLSASV